MGYRSSSRGVFSSGDVDGNHALSNRVNGKRLARHGRSSETDAAEATPAFVQFCPQLGKLCKALATGSDFARGRSLAPHSAAACTTFSNTVQRLHKSSNSFRSFGLPTVLPSR
jgi:hypothetical protein